MSRRAPLSRRRLLRDERGASMIELGFLSPVLLVLVLGIVDAAMGFSAKLKLQQAAARSVEMATTGGISSAAIANLGAEAAAASGQDASHITVDKWLECDGVRQSNIDGSCNSGAQIARFVSVSVTASYSPMMSRAMSLFGLPTTLPITGDASVRVQ